MLEPEKYDEELRRHVAAFEQLLSAVDVDAQVPTCPGWSVHDLVEHLGTILDWARQALVEGDSAHPPDLPEEAAPTGSGALRGWFCERADRVVDTLADVGTEQPCWGFGLRPRTSAFWWRRMTHEMAIHLHDLRAAHAGSSRDVDEPVWGTTEMASDAVEEVVRVFFPRQVRRDRCEPLQAAVLMMPEDAEGSGWVLAGDGSDDDAIADVTVTGPVEQLALLVWHRLDVDDDRLTIQGERAAVEHVMASEITP
ncbi:maleylpyruvate isomerase family mycothiol-dependent enzyme [Nocardioidaceae bacterium]|nr:maleylpyruvate isomerase family mycothiol-dependent enzyme [Nocardioidaceae bacterium]